MNMAEKKLFNEIRDEYQSYQLPFDEADWNDLEARLNKKDQKKAVFFISRKLYIPAAAAVAAGIILLVTVLSKQPANENIATINHEVVSNNVTQKELPVTETETQDYLPPAANPVIVASSRHTEKRNATNSVIVAVNPDVVNKEIAVVEDTCRALPAPFENVADNKPANTYVNKNNKQVNYPKEMEWGGMEPETTPSNFRVAANGGLNYNTSKLGYSVGASISKSISKKVALQADLAFLDNSRQSSYSQRNVTTRQISGLNGYYTAFDTSYQKTTKDYKQNYAQVALSVDLSLTQRNNVCVGVDVQRLLNGEQEDENNTSFQRASNWNSGVLLRYRYDLNQKLSLGLSYRQDVTSAIQKTWQNNALQVYLNYYIKSK